MSEEIPELVAVIQAHRRRLEAVCRSMESALDGEIVQLGKTPMSALIVAGLLENYYTCLATIFLRISQSFENKLDPARWHNDLLQKMTLEIEGVRTAAVSEETFSPLFELLKFRHFKRYYSELEYDWDRLDFLVTKLRQVHPLVTRDLERFVRFAGALDQH
ncbi:MAG: hypothetical protein OXU81_22160 [Gammaproteobacteria bacterium]|nr:hypothetical protein [Gammaproteobacteria bacterium]